MLRECFWLIYNMNDSSESSSGSASLQWHLLCTYYLQLKRKANKRFRMVDYYFRGSSSLWPTVFKIDWSKEIIVVTGSAAGLGFHIQKTLRERGARVIGLDVVKRDAWTDYYECDVSNVQAVKQTARLIKEQVGVPTVLVSNAGIVRPGTILETPIADVRRTLDVNFTAQFILVQAFLPDMLKHGGHWLTVGSTLGYIGGHSLSTYTASKAAVISFHESLTAEVGPYSNLATTLLVPGQMSDSMFAKLDPPNTFLAPSADLEKVAAIVAYHIECRHKGEFAMPLYGRFMGIMRVLPSGMQQLARRFSGMDAASEAFSKLQA